jgi:hypothetical protein
MENNIMKTIKTAVFASILGLAFSMPTASIAEEEEEVMYSCEITVEAFGHTKTINITTSDILKAELIKEQLEDKFKEHVEIECNIET